MLVAMTDPTNVRAVDDISIMTGRDVRPAVASRRGHRRRHGPHEQARLRRRGGDRGGRGGGGAEPAEVDRDPRVGGQRPGRSSSSTASSRRPSRRGHPTSTSSPRAGTCACATAWTGCCTTPPRSRARMVAGVISRLKIMGEPRHRREAAAPGRPHQPDGRAAPDRHPRWPRCPSVHGEKMVLRLLDKEQGADHARASSACRRTRSRRFQDVVHALLRRHARHRPDRVGQDHQPLRGAERDQHAREKHHHDRGPGRVPAPGHDARSRST